MSRHARALVAALLFTLALPTVVLGGHIGADLAVTDLGDCQIRLSGTSSELRESGSWTITSQDDATYPAILGEYVTRGGKVTITPSSTIDIGIHGTYLLQWDSEPLGSWERSHEELLFEVCTGGPIEPPETPGTPVVPGPGPLVPPIETDNPNTPLPDIPLPETDTVDQVAVEQGQMQVEDVLLLIGFFAFALAALGFIADRLDTFRRR